MLPSFLENNPLPPEKGLKRKNGRAAILVMWSWRHEQTFILPSQGGSTFNFDWPSSFGWGDLRILMIICMYIAPVQRQTISCVLFCQKHKFPVKLIICCKLLPLHDILTVSPFKRTCDQIWLCRILFVAVILVMGSRCREQTSVPLNLWGFTQNLIWFAEQSPRRSLF